MADYIMILGGLMLLVAGGEMLVSGATSAAKAFGVSPLIIGLTLVGFGTSTPELVTTVTAALAGAPGIAIGNVVGSNTANILLVLGVSAMIYPLAVDPRSFRRDAIVLVAATLAALAVVLVGSVGRLTGAALIAALIAYVVFLYLHEGDAPQEEIDVKRHMAEDAPHGPRKPALALGLAALGVGLTIVGAKLLIDGAIELASDLGVSDTIIGLTIVAVGTSMPELITSAVAAIRKHGDVAYGNIIGSNIYNILFILGTAALIEPIAIPAQIARFDIWIMVAATALLVLFARTGFKLHRWEGFAFVVAYAAYVGALIFRA